MDITDDIEQYLLKTKIPFTIITDELLTLVKDSKIKIENVITGDLQSSFDEGYVVYCREVMTEEILIILHTFFRNSCCNIENVVLITCDTLGLDRYYKQFCELHRTRGFNIIEIPFQFWDNFNVTSETKQMATLPKKKAIKSLFTFYGGTYEVDPPQRTIISLFASQYSDISYVDTNIKAESWDKINNYLEYLTYFCDVESITHYKKIYNSMVKNSQMFIPKLFDLDFDYYEKMDRKGPQWLADSQSFFSLVRETNCTQNFYCLTEKTMKCFFNGVAPIPVHGDKYVIDDLEALGFKINKTFIDYSYLHEENLFFRLQKLKDQLDKFRLVTYDDWLSLWLDNYNMFNYNSEYLVNSYKKEIIIPRLDNYFK